MSTEVQPPCRQCTTWWASHQVAGTVHPEKLQPWSRAIEREALAAGEEALAAPHVERLAVAAEHHRDHLGVTGHPARDPGRQGVRR